MSSVDHDADVAAVLAETSGWAGLSAKTASGEPSSAVDPTPIPTPDLATVLTAALSAAVYVPDDADEVAVVLAALTAAGYAVVKVDEVERLKSELEEAQLRSIEARNPGIDLDEVRHIRERKS